MELNLRIFYVSEEGLNSISLKSENYLLGYAYLLTERGERSEDIAADNSLSRFPVLLRPSSTEKSFEIDIPASTGPTRYLEIPKSIFDYQARKVKSRGSSTLSLFADTLKVSDSSAGYPADKIYKKISGTVRFMTESERTSYFLDGLTSSCHEDPASVISQKLVQLIRHSLRSTKKTSAVELDMASGLSGKQSAQVSGATSDQHTVYWLTAQIILEMLSHQFGRTCQNICDADLLVEAIEKDDASLIGRLDTVLTAVTLYVGLSKLESRQTNLLDGTYDCLSNSILLSNETPHRSKLEDQTFANSPTLTSILACLELSRTECPSLSLNEKMNVFGTLQKSLLQGCHSDIIQAHRLTKALSPMFGPIFEVFVAQSDKTIIEHGILSFAGLNKALSKALAAQ